MAATFPLNIVTPERSVLSESVSSVQLPSMEGSLGILAGHAPLVATLKAGECVVLTANGARETLAIAGGFVEVTHQRVTVLADTAEFAHEIDVNHAEAALAKAREMLANVGDNGSASEREHANEEIGRHRARISVVRSRGN